MSAVSTVTGQQAAVCMRACRPVHGEGRGVPRRRRGPAGHHMQAAALPPPAARIVHKLIARTHDESTTTRIPAELMEARRPPLAT
jgi:hypothetical protein